MPTKNEIRACPDLRREFTSDSDIDLDDFLSRFHVGDDDDIDIFALWEEVVELQRERREEIAKKLIASNGGDAYGLELAHRNDAERLACIFAEPSWHGGFRLSMYDIHGPSSHHLFASPEEALAEAIVLGYCNLAPGKLDQMTDLPSWKKGLEWCLTLLKGFPAMS